MEEMKAAEGWVRASRDAILGSCLASIPSNPGGTRTRKLRYSVKMGVREGVWQMDISDISYPKSFHSLNYDLTSCSSHASSWLAFPHWANCLDCICFKSSVLFI